MTAPGDKRARDAVDLVRADPWDGLRRLTSARIALGRVGSSMPTDEVLRFGLAHARARDAVHHPMDAQGLVERLRTAGFAEHGCVSSRATSRQEYLLRPDLGRQLDPADLDRLRAAAHHPDAPSTSEDDRPAGEGRDAAEPASNAKQARIVVVLADGLSSVATEKHAILLLESLRKRLNVDWAAVPVVVAVQARVALGDDVGEALGADLVIVLIGERPGLTSPDSLGIYFTWRPRRGRADSERNCISNVRPEGLPYEEAAAKLAHMAAEALRRGLTGVALKDDSDEAMLDLAAPPSAGGLPG